MRILTHRCTQKGTFFQNQGTLFLFSRKDWGDPTPPHPATDITTSTTSGKKDTIRYYEWTNERTVEYYEWKNEYYE